MVYKHLFTLKETDQFRLTCPINFCHSAAFLSTCKQIHQEGCQFLYGTNEFLFDRQVKQRALYWETSWMEVGWKDVHLFLTSIGPTNISLIRKLHIELSDAAPSTTPSHYTSDDRRCVYDEYLIDCFRMLAKYASIDVLEVQFHVRKLISKDDRYFLDHLSKIKADKLIIPQCQVSPIHWRRRQSSTGNHLDGMVEKILRGKIERKHKLYSGNESNVHG